MSPLRVLVATDEFGGTLTAAEAAAAVARGWARSAPDDPLRLAPMADGGPGFLATLNRALGGRRVPVPAHGPLGEPRTAEVLLVGSGGGATAYVESAQVMGSAPGDTQRPWDATSSGLAPLLRAAVAEGAQRVVVGIGGTASTDGGRGVVEALGDWPAGVALVAAADVPAPLLGAGGAALGFAAQKGADESMAQRLEQRLAEWVTATGGDANAAGAGAGGGLGYGLALLGARAVPGAAVVADALGFDELVRGCDLVVSGEGRFDWSSLRGKVVAEVARRAVAAGRPCLVLAGQVAVGEREARAIGVDEALGVADEVGSVPAAVADPAGGLARLAERAARQWSRR